jgi:putative transposase
VVEHEMTGVPVGIDVGVKEFSTDSTGNRVANPRSLRKAEQKVKRLHRRLSRTQKKSQNRKKARQEFAKADLKVQRQREDCARKQANALVTSHDLMAMEDVQIANLVKNHHLAKSISDAAWGRFLEWVRYDGMIHTVPVVEVAPHWTSQKCSGCGCIVKKSLSERTHSCVHCGLVLDRDENAARNILALALQWIKEQESGTGGHPATGTPRRVRNASGQKTTPTTQK